MFGEHIRTQLSSNNCCHWNFHYWRCKLRMIVKLIKTNIGLSQIAKSMTVKYFNEVCRDLKLHELSFFLCREFWLGTSGIWKLIERVVYNNFARNIGPSEIVNSNRRSCNEHIMLAVAERAEDVNHPWYIYQYIRVLHYTSSTTV